MAEKQKDAVWGKKKGEDQKNGIRSANRASWQIQDDGLKVQGLRDGFE